jgi:hypothetical protein
MGATSSSPGIECAYTTLSEFFAKHPGIPIWRSLTGTIQMSPHSVFYLNRSGFQPTPPPILSMSASAVLPLIMVRHCRQKTSAILRLFKTSTSRLQQARDGALAVKGYRTQFTSVLLTGSWRCDLTTKFIQM